MGFNTSRLPKKRLQNSHDVHWVSEWAEKKWTTFLSVAIRSLGPIIKEFLRETFPDINLRSKHGD